MFNPFHPFTTVILERFIKANKTFFVRQLFERGISPVDKDIKASFLFTQYPNLAAAQQHLGAIPDDKYARIYDYSIDEDRTKLLVAAKQPGGYKTYCNIFENNWKNMITEPLKMKLKYYIDNTLGWNPGGAENVDFTIFVHYGKVYGRIKFKSKEARVQLEDIEKIKL